MKLQHRGNTVIVLKVDDGLGLSYLGRLEGKGTVFCRIARDGDLWSLNATEMRLYTDIHKAHGAALDYIVKELETISKVAETTAKYWRQVDDLLSSLEEGRNDL